MIKIGKSTDIHQIKEGNKLIVGGVYIPYKKGNIGHSDGDCLLHTVAESLLGALALGDLGTHFPDNSEEYFNISSSILVEKVMNMIKKEGYRVINIDSTIFLQEPKLKPYIYKMRENIAALLETDISNISIKATTTEKLGAVGENKAIAAESIVLVTND